MIPAQFYNKLKVLIACVLIALCTTSHGAIEKQRKLFQKLYYAALSGNATAVAQQRGPLKDYALDHYLDYALLVAKMSALPESDIKQFKKDNPDSILNKRLKDKFIDALGSQKKWKTYLKYYSGVGTGKRQCWYLNARIANQQTENIGPLVQTMWLSGLSAPSQCDPVFKWWDGQGMMTEALIKQRFELAFEASNESLSRYLKKKLINPPMWMDYALDLLATPMPALEQSLTWPADEMTRQFVAKTAERLSKKQPATMHELWPKIQKHYQIKGGVVDRVRRNIALFAATDYAPFSIDAMKQLPDYLRDNQIKAWIVRFYLYHMNWKQVLASLKEMNEEQLNQDRWQYWLGRSYAKTGQLEAARSTFSKLQTKSNYYGFLAADHMRMPYRICQKDSPASVPFKYPAAIERAIELHHAGLVYMARREWNTAYSGLSKNQKLALADDLQKNHAWHSKVIAIMADLGEWRNYEKRYPIAHEGQIKKHLGSYNIMPQWVMAIIKQESAWIKDAVSPADAHGLMQIIPPTAERLSKQLGLQFDNKRQLHQADFNLRLGIHYQNNLFKRFDHPILVAAAYNAGERKSDDWSKDFPVSPDVWLETIPYRETRDYITRILSNVTIYDWLINSQPKRISAWMPTMPINGSAPQPWPSVNLSQQTAGVVCGP